MRLYDIFQKQGGVELIKQYIKGGAIFTAIAEFLLLGKNTTGLEILRLAANYKINKNLKKKYVKYLIEFDDNWTNIEGKKADIIWVCWLQGIENAPKIVQVCIDSIKRNVVNKKIIVITNENLSQFVHFPQIIQKKIDDGIIHGAHLSDLIRIELLTNYGGTWIDATVFCSSTNIPSYMLDSELFMFQLLKPGKDGQSAVISNWLITAYSNNKLLVALKFLLYKYWENNDDLVDYYIFHDLFQLIIEYYPNEWAKVIPVSSSMPHVLLLKLFEPYNEDVWNAVTEQTCFHKLTYKFDSNSEQIAGTYYRKIVGLL